MKLTELTCKNCKAKLNIEADAKEIVCQFCGTAFVLDDEAKHIKYDNAFEAGYEFEKGRMKAQTEEHEQISINVKPIQPIKQKKKHWIWLIFAWTFLLPFTLSYYIITSKKLNNTKKVILLIISWIIISMIIVHQKQEYQKELKELITTCYSEEAHNQLIDLIGYNNIVRPMQKKCENLSLKTQNSQKIIIELNDDKQLISIRLDDKYIYHIDKNVQVYNPKSLGIEK